MIRLINTASLELVEFQANIPAYAILSHTHDNEEITYQEWTAAFPSNSPGRLDQVATKAGFHKIAAFCLLCQDQGHAWAWADVCCIDRKSSAEVLESINSMYKWYSRSITCFAYLSDVPTDDNVHHISSAFSKSRWFTRGWTLQELIAPRHVEFLSKDWKILGSKRSLPNILARITGIDFQIGGALSLSQFSLAERMSWAASRETLVEEDLAYSLMGLFNVSMPVLYGEGRNAFRRLQIAIMKHSEDHTLFAWTEAPYSESYTKPDDTTTWELLAPSPAYFKRSAAYRRITPEVMRRGLVGHLDHSIIHRPFRMTNQGLRIPLYLIPRQLVPSLHSNDCHSHCMLALLNCYAMDSSSSAVRPQLAIHIHPHASGRPLVFERGRCRSVELITKRLVMQALVKSISRRLSKVDAAFPGRILIVYISGPAGL